LAVVFLIRLVFL